MVTKFNILTIGFDMLHSAFVEYNNHDSSTSDFTYSLGKVLTITLYWNPTPQHKHTNKNKSI